MRMVSFASEVNAMPFSALNVTCGEYLQKPGVGGGQPADDSPLPYSASSESQPPCSSFTSTPLVAPQRCSLSDGVQSVGDPKHGASNCVSKPLLTEYV